MPTHDKCAISQLLGGAQVVREPRVEDEWTVRASATPAEEAAEYSTPRPLRRGVASKCPPAEAFSGCCGRGAALPSKT